MSWSDRHVVPTILLAAAVAGCSGLSGRAPDLQIDNETTLNVALFINGANVGHAFRQTTATILGSDLPPLPWHVEARTGGGRVLVAFEVPSGGTPNALGRRDLSCGRLDVFVGADPPLDLPGPGVPGDCEP